MGGVETAPRRGGLPPRGPGCGISLGGAGGVAAEGWRRRGGSRRRLGGSTRSISAWGDLGLGRIGRSGVQRPAGTRAMPDGPGQCAPVAAPRVRELPQRLAGPWINYPGPGRLTFCHAAVTLRTHPWVGAARAVTRGVAEHTVSRVVRSGASSAPPGRPSVTDPRGGGARRGVSSAAVTGGREEVRLDPAPA